MNGGRKTNYWIYSMNEGASKIITHFDRPGLRQDHIKTSHIVTDDSRGGGYQEMEEILTNLQRIHPENIHFDKSFSHSFQWMKQFKDLNKENKSRPWFYYCLNLSETSLNPFNDFPSLKLNFEMSSSFYKIKN